MTSECMQEKGLSVRRYSVFRRIWEFTANGPYKEVELDLNAAKEFYSKSAGLGEMGLEEPLFLFVTAGELWLKIGSASAARVPEGAMAQVRVEPPGHPEHRILSVGTDPPVAWRYRSLWPETPELARWDETEEDVDLAVWFCNTQSNQERRKYFIQAHALDSEGET